MGGVVKRKTSKGFGFITPSDNGDDIFFHKTEVKSNGGYQSLMEREAVSFEVIVSDDGKRKAVNVYSMRQPLNNNNYGQPQISNNYGNKRFGGGRNERFGTYSKGRGQRGRGGNYRGGYRQNQREHQRQNNTRINQQ